MYAFISLRTRVVLAAAAIAALGACSQKSEQAAEQPEPAASLRAARIVYYVIPG